MITAKQVDIRYATALLQLAQEQGVEKAVYDDLVELRILTFSNREFKSFLKNPVIKTSQKGRILQKMFDGVFHKLTLDFLLLILKKARINNIINIATAYVRIYRKEHHFTTVTVYTAKELLTQQKQGLLETLTNQLPGETIELRNRIYPEVIGGLIIRYGDYLYNESIGRKLRNFRRGFESNLYETHI
jgi:F-type H+-transporting ATPase subunit delta